MIRAENGQSFIFEKKQNIMQKVCSFLTMKPLEDKCYLVTNSIGDSTKKVKLELYGKDFDKKLKEAKFLLELKNEMVKNTKE